MIYCRLFETHFVHEYSSHFNIPSPAGLLQAIQTLWQSQHLALLSWYCVDTQKYELVSS